MPDKSTKTIGTVQPSQRSPLEDFGLVGWLEKTRVKLPLKGVECRFDVCGDIASVEMEQVFHQTNKEAINCTYTFPLPGNAAVWRCVVQIGERTITAKVEELEKARAAFKEKVQAGHRAGLVEVERENLFTLSLGNLQPQDVIVVKMAYFQTVDRLDKQVSLLIPFCPGVRYVPGKPLWRDSKGKGTVADTDQVPDASVVTPPRMSARHEDAAYVNIEGTVDCADLDPSSLVSPQHKITTAPPALTPTPTPTPIHISIDMDSAIPDRDFVLRWTEKPVSAAVANAWTCQTGGGTFALVQLRAPEEVVVANDDYEQDDYFLIDRSGSMAGEKWAKTAQALQQFVRELGPKDRVWITFFENEVQDFSDRPLLARDLLKDRNFSAIEQRGTGGGTEMLPAIQHVLSMTKKFSFGKNRRANLIIITDGQVGNEAAVIEALRPFPRLQTHAFGIDVAVNDAFLRTLTRQQRGQVIFQTPADDISAAVAALGAKLRRPVLTDVQVGSGWEFGEAGVRDLCAGDILNVSLRQTADAPLALTGLRPNGQKHQFSFTPVLTTNPAIKLLWFKDRISSLLDSHQDAEAIQLAVQNNLLCRGTAFIAWDEHEQVPIAGKEIYQPSMEVCESRASLSMNLCDTAAGSAGFLKKVFRGARSAGKSMMMESFGGDNWVGCASPRDVSDPAQDLPLFASSDGLKFLAELRSWADLEPTEASSRKNALKKLVADLLRHRTDLGQCREICRQFIHEHVLRAAFEKSVQRLSDELKSAKGKPSACRAICERFLKELDASQAHPLLDLLARL